MDMNGKLCGHYPTNGNERLMNRRLSPRIHPELVAGAHLAPRVRSNPGIAVLVPPGNQTLFREALRAELSKNRNGPRINLVARNYAERHLSKEGILSQWEKDAFRRGDGAHMNRKDTGTRGNA
jgi:hypothetical protein